MPSSHAGLTRHLFVAPPYGAPGRGGASAPGRTAPGRHGSAPSHGGSAPTQSTPGIGSHTHGLAHGHVRPGDVVSAAATGLRHMTAARKPFFAGLQMTGVEDVMPAAGSGGDQTNYTPTSDTPPVDTSTPGGIAQSLLGSITGDLSNLMGGGGGGGSTSVTAPTAVTYGEGPGGGNVIAPGQNVYTQPAPGPARPPTTIIPAPAPVAKKSNLLWWILGGVAVATIGFIAWRMFGHKGAAATAKGAAKAAAYYGAYGWY